MNLESLLSAVSDHAFGDFSHVSPALLESGFSLEAIQAGKDPQAPHGEVFRVTHNSRKDAIGVLKLSAANSASKLMEDLAFSQEHRISVPKTHIFPV